MRRFRFSKVRLTDYRPPGAGRISPLERQGATRGGSVAGTKVSAMHDHAVADYPPALAEKVLADLGRMIRSRCFSGFELKWVQARAEALAKRTR